MISKGQYQSDLEYWFIMNGGRFECIFCEGGGSGDFIGRKYSTLLDGHAGTWYHFACIYDGSETEAGIRLYIDGVRVDDTSRSNGSYSGMSNMADKVEFGRFEVVVEGDGKMDEIRMSKTNRSVEWLLTSFNTTDDPSSFFTLGSEEAGAVGGFMTLNTDYWGT